MTFLLAGVAVLALNTPLSSFARSRAGQQYELAVDVQLELPAADVEQAVQEVAQDQIIHGTYSYEKEKVLYGAHSASSARVFGSWSGLGKVYYKIAESVLSPRHFKNSEDVGTITVRYVVQPIDKNMTSLRIAAIYVDARNVRYASEGNVESSEYATIQEHIKNAQEARSAREDAAEQAAQQNQGTESKVPNPPPQTVANADSSPIASSSGSTPSLSELRIEVQELRRKVVLQVTDQDAALKSAPFKGASTISSVPAHSEVLIQVLTPYWYGVETEDGHHGWIHRSQLEALP